MASSINVKIAPLPRGDYSSSATYAKLDVVSYNGSSYMAIKAVPTGTVPTNTTYWQLLAEKPTIGEGTITTNMLADGAVTADKLDSSVSEVYAEVSGTYEDMVVGSAEQLLSTQYDTDSVPYAFRKSPYGDREFDEIVGGSIAWNQWVVNGNFADTSNWSKNGVTMTVSGNVATLTSSSNGDHYSQQAYQDSIPVGHKVIYSTDVKVDSMPSGESSVLALSFFYGYASYRDTYYATDTNWHTIAKVKNIEPTAGSNPRLVALRLESRKSTVTAQFRNAQLFDLTQMFGSTVADAIYAMEQSSSGSGVAFFRSLFPKPYYAYNAGQLISVTGLTAHRTTGFNQWDEEWEVGGMKLDGQPSSSTTEIRCKNYIPAFPNTQYCFTTPLWGVIYQYDADKNFLLRTPLIGGGFSPLFTTLANTAYIRFYCQASYGTTYKNDICINLSWDGERNGEYEPYESHSYALDDSLTLRGVPKLVDNKVQFDGDIYSSDGTVERRCGARVLDGSETWAWDSTNLLAYTIVDDLIKVDAVSQHYPITINNNAELYDKSWAGRAEAEPSIGPYWGQPRLYLKGSSITSANDAKTYFTNKPTNVVYLLNSSITESAEPYVSPQICNEYGTEEYISAEQSGVTMIVGHNTKYPQNLRKKIEGLPWNFSSLIAPTEVTNKATRNYTVGSFLIMNNTLYKVTSAIANGGTITVGSNVSATTIMQEILAL